eukprot:TRINITY_DN12404_c3_g1_i1.p2 TRINITY_DN12404_c3_g1~~TRINITY_DN12404_c3_g1_i1.p2  ORF type:complete len:281 (+),score=35.57 TRINITY_DN12404_c3_g1_i1:1-843(+)
MSFHARASCPCIIAEVIAQYSCPDTTVLLLVSRVEIEMLLKQFATLATRVGNHPLITRDTFQRCLGPLGLSDNIISSRVFDVVFARGEECVGFESFLAGLSDVLKGTHAVRANLAFKGYDLDGKGWISREDMHVMLKAHFDINMIHVKEVIDNLDEELVDKFDPDDDKPVSSLFTAAIPAATGPAPAKPEESSVTEPGVAEETVSALSMALQDGNNEAWHRQRLNPLISSISEEALDKVVESIFSDFGDASGRLQRNEFLAATQVEPLLLAWLDVLGTIF